MQRDEPEDDEPENYQWGLDDATNLPQDDEHVITDCFANARQAPRKSSRNRRATAVQTCTPSGM